MSLALLATWRGVVSLNGGAGGEEQWVRLTALRQSGGALSEHRVSTSPGLRPSGSDRTTDANGIRSPLLPPLARRKVLPYLNSESHVTVVTRYSSRGYWSDLGIGLRPRHPP